MSIPALADRFTSHVEPEPNSGCWLWAACDDGRKGYGFFRVGGRVIRAHRASWLIFKGDIPHGLMVLHRCDVTCCVNPDHLFLGTNAENMADMVNKGRLGRRVQTPSAEARARNSEALKGRKKSPETRERMRAAWVIRKAKNAAQIYGAALPQGGK